MGALSSSSTLADAEAQYRDNLSYDVDNDPAKARLFVEACRYLIQAQFSSATNGATSLAFRLEMLQGELKDAVDWLYKRDEDLRGLGPTRTYIDLRASRLL